MNTLRIAGIFVPAISFFSAFGQIQSEIILHKWQTTVCENDQKNYLELNQSYSFLISMRDTSFDYTIKKVKFISPEFKISKIKGVKRGCTALATKTGTSFLYAKVVLQDGTKHLETCVFNVVELPLLDVEITVTSPDSKFMWLNLIDKNTRQSANSSFSLCSIQFELCDSTGAIKEKGQSVEGDDYFPSVTLQQLPVQFGLNDKLKLKIVVMHYEYGLPVHINKELTIKKLWN